MLERKTFSIVVMLNDVRSTQKKAVKYLLIYHHNQVLTSAMYIILANMNEQLCSWTFKYRKVVRQQIWGKVADFIPAFCAVQHWNATMKVLLKLVNVWPSYYQNKKDAILWLAV